MVDAMVAAKCFGMRDTHLLVWLLCIAPTHRRGAKVSRQLHTRTSQRSHTLCVFVNPTERTRSGPVTKQGSACDPRSREAEKNSKDSVAVGATL
jgi:hypothetical protein